MLIHKNIKDACGTINVWFIDQFKNSFHFKNQCYLKLKFDLFALTPGQSAPVKFCDCNGQL